MSNADVWNGYEDWEKAFKQRRLGKKALSELQSLERYCPLDFPMFVDVVLQGCFAAYTYDDALDPEKQIYYRQIEVRKQIPVQLEAIKQIQQFLRKYPSEANRITSLAGIDAANAGVLLIANSKVEGELLKKTEIMLDVYLQKLSERLIYAEAHTPKLGGYGALNLGTAIVSTKLRHRSVDLMFELVLRFRTWTRATASDDTNTRLMAPSRMPRRPRSGKPCYALVASFVNATFENAAKDFTADMVENSVKQLLVDYPDLRFVDYPHTRQYEHHSLDELGITTFEDFWKMVMPGKAIQEIKGEDPPA